MILQQNSAYFLETRRIITAVKQPRHLSLSWARWIQSTSYSVFRVRCAKMPLILCRCYAVPHSQLWQCVFYRIVDKARCVSDNDDTRNRDSDYVLPCRSTSKQKCPVTPRRGGTKCDKRLSASSCPSVRKEQLDSHWTDFHEIWYISIFRKSSQKIQFSLKSCCILLRMRNVLDKSCWEN
jgi:hypothetical protein